MIDAASASPCPRPVIFGEVLFDCFPDRRVLGGAPFNVAWNLQGLAGTPLFIGAVGDDEAGAQVRRVMGEWGMVTAGLQTDPARPTGSVRVILESGEPRYEILADCAYDHVKRDEALHAAGSHRGGILYHGSLALRGEESRETFAALRARMGERVFMDVNLREPWWRRDAVHAWMAAASWVKLNQEELAALAPAGTTLEDQAQAVLEGFDLAAVIVTRAAEGAMVLTADGACLSGTAPAVDGLVDTVGAGDAFSAVVLTGLAGGWGWAQILERAAGFAARVCTLRGATTRDRRFYAATLIDWRG